MFDRVPVIRLSTQITSCPSARKRSHRWEPMNPAPPVISVRMTRHPLPLSGRSPVEKMRNFRILCGRWARAEQCPPLALPPRHLSKEAAARAWLATPQAVRPRAILREVDVHADPSYPHVHCSPASTGTPAGTSEAGLQPLVVLEPGSGGTVPPHRRRELRGPRS